MTMVLAGVGKTYITWVTCTHNPGGEPSGKIIIITASLFYEVVLYDP